MELILEEMRGVPDERRGARFRCVIAIAAPGGATRVVDGVFEGRIGHEPRGANGFGYDPIFVVPERGVTSAELPSEEKNAMSHRGQAARAGDGDIEGTGGWRRSTVSGVRAGAAMASCWTASGGAMRDLRISRHRPLQLPLPLLHAARGVRRRTSQFLPRAEILSFEEIARVARIFVDARRAQAAPDRRRAAVARATCRRWCGCSSAIPGRRHRADDERLAARGAGAARSRTPGCAA